MSDLRTGLVEAMARGFNAATWVMGGNPDWDKLPTESQRFLLAGAAAALDKGLGFLTDNAEAWQTAAHVERRDIVRSPYADITPWASDFLAVLSDSRDTGEKP